LLFVQEFLNTKDTKVTKEDLKNLCVLRVLCV